MGCDATDRISASDAPGAAISCISIGRMVSATIASRLSFSRSKTRTTEPAKEFSTGASSASAAPSAMAVKAVSNVCRGMVVIALPRSWIAAASLKAPGSPWKATRMVLRLGVLIGRRLSCNKERKTKSTVWPANRKKIGIGSDRSAARSRATSELAAVCFLASENLRYSASEIRCGIRHSRCARKLIQAL